MILPRPNSVRLSAVCVAAVLLTLTLLTTRPGAAAPSQRLSGAVPAAVGKVRPIERLAADKRLNLAIGLPLRNQEALDRFLKELYDPSSPNYRHFLTPEEFAARFGPTEQDYDAVISFAQAHGLTVTRAHPNRALLSVSGSVGDIERALHVALRVYPHPTEGRTFYAPDTEPELDLAAPVLGIRGLNDYALARPRLQAVPLDSQSSPTPNAGSGPSGTYMGNDFRAAYAPDSALTGSGQAVGLVQFDGYTASDITYYKTVAGLPDVPLMNVLVDGASGNPSGGGGEVEVCLDIETAISMAPGLSKVIVYMAPNPSPFVDILNRMATDNLAKQLSCSWYLPHGGPDLVADQIFQQMAAQGQSFYNASGDYDAFTGPVSFPGETPYIIQVGGTTLTTAAPGGAWVSETVWNWHNGIGSGGGISTRYTIPSYQVDIDMTLNQGSTTMRNIPDVALTADNIYVRAHGRDYNVAGTSCSAPLWAGFTALVNQQATATGRPTVGFIMPAIDAIGHAANYGACFHDTTTGDNTSSSSPTKFYAVAGYDLCTGWGTPTGQRLINALANPDPLAIIPSALAFSGDVGGPFTATPSSLTLTNVGTNSLDWTLVNTSAWFNVSPTSGTLTPGGPATAVTVSVDASANSLPAGLYSALLAFTNQTSEAGQFCTLTLSVAAPGMADDFEPDIDLAQWSSFGGEVGTTVLATNYGGSVSASNSLWFGAADSRFATTVPINTTAGGDIGFCLRLADGPDWPWAQANNLPAQAVVLECSTNGGGNWTLLGAYDSAAYYNWTGVTLPVPVEAQVPAALFRWRQLSNRGTNYDHWALDNVIVGTGLLAPQIVMDPQDQSIAVGDPGSFSVAAVGSRPLSYQWLFNGSNISGATDSSLVWTNVQMADAGSYSVFLSNAVGTAISSNAVLAVYTPVCTPPLASMVGWWRAEGDATDAVGSNDGTLYGGTVFSAGRVGQGFSFNGSTAYVSIPPSSSIDVGTGEGLTIECWIKPASATANQALLEWSTEAGKLGAHLWISQPPPFGSGSGSIYLNLVDAAGTYHTLTSPPGLITTNGFQHITATYDKASGAVCLYYNGSLAAQQSLGSFTAQTGLSLYLGKRPNVSSSYYQGQMDEVSLYSRALSAAEVYAIYYAGSAGKCVQPTPPSIAVQPQNQTVGEGANVALSVEAAGSRPLSYQWEFNEAPVSGATDTVLRIIKARLSDAGSYRAVVTNLYGSVTSSSAMLTVQEVTCAPVPSNLVAWWQGEGNLLDAMGTNNGAAHGNVTFADGEVGSAFSFDGSTAYLTIPSSAGLNVGSGEGLTIECWINPASANANQTLVEWSTEAGQLGAHLWISQPPPFGSGSGSIYLNLVDTLGSYHTLTSPAGLVMSNEFQHVTATYNKATGATCLYYNGSLVASQSLGSFTTQTGLPLHLGKRPSDASSFYRGLMDEVSLYGRALSAAEIQVLYEAASAGKCGLAPFIAVQPKSRVVASGHSAIFEVLAGGSQPLTYQWSANNFEIAGATERSLTLTNVGLDDGGEYFVAVSNVLGAVTSVPAVLTVSTSTPCEPAPLGLVGWWAGEGNAEDNAGMAPGELHGATGFVPGEVGEGFNFDGSTAYVTIPPATAIDVGSGEGLTMECWIKPASATANQTLLEWSTEAGQLGVHLWISQPPPYGSGSGSIYLNLVDTTGYYHTLTTPAGIITTNAFQHVAATYDKATGMTRLYYNGNPVASQSLGTFTARTGLTLYFGKRPNVGSSCYRGMMDEVSVYSRALSAIEIGAIYEAGSAGKCGSAPFITAQPENQAVTVGQAAIFAAQAGGLRPLTYQWSANNAEIAGATGSTLTLTNAGLNDGGTYSVVVSNWLGSVTSTPAVLTVIPSAPCAPVASGIVSWWAGEGASNDRLGANNGQLHGSMGFVSGEVGLAFDFDGTTAFVTVPPSPSLNVGVGGGFTIEGWIKPASATANQALFEWNSGSGQLGVHVWTSQPAPFGTGSGCIYANLVDTTGAYHTLTTGAGVIGTNNLQHVAITYDKTTGATCIYHDGQPVATQTLGGFTAQTSLTLYLGERPGVPSSVFRGLMDEVSLYGRALNAAEIQAIFDAGSSGKCLPAPTVQIPPASQTVEVSSNAAFAVTVTGLLPLAYQWYVGTNAIAGETNAQLLLTSVGFAQAGSYSVVITNAYGSATGGPATLTIVDTIPPSIDLCPTNRTLSAGANCNASLPDLTGELVASDASGSISVAQVPPPGALLGLGVTNVTFTARDSSGNSSTCFSVVTVVDSTPPFVLASVLELALGFDTNCQALLPDLTTTNYIIASDNCSAISVAQLPLPQTALPAGTNVVLLTVSDSASNQTTRAVNVVVAGAPQISAQPADLTAVLTSNATLCATACGSVPLNYQWQHQGTNLPSGTNAVLVLSNIKTNDAGQYQVFVSNLEAAVTSAVATLTVLQPPVITRQPANLIAAPGAAVSFSVLAKGLAPLNYQWQKNGSPLAGRTNATLTLTNLGMPDYATYMVAITNADGWILSREATLTLAASPLLRAVSFNVATFILEIPTEVGPMYVVEYKDTLEDSDWRTLTTVGGTGSPIQISDNGLTNAVRFYRVRVR